MRATGTGGFSADLRERYLLKLKTSLSLLQSTAERLSQGAADQSDFELLEREAHRLNGTGATYGYPAISAAAFALEQSLRSGSRDTTIISALLLCLLKPLLGAITAGKAGLAEASAEQGAETDEYLPLILVAGENANFCRRLVKVLRPFARTECFISSNAALRAAQRQRFDLILLDYGGESIVGQNGVQNGIGGLKTGDQAGAPIIVLASGHNGLSPALKASLGVWDCITKPFPSRLLVDRIKAALQAHKPKVLVVDDDPFVRGLFTSKLRQRGVDVSVASCGQEAIEMALLLRPRAIILDRMMPRVDGIEVLAMIRSNAELSNTPVLMLSARRMESDVIEGLARGADDYVCKPFQPENVVDRCLDLLRNNRQLAA
jgi:DNA-binding response OmpR family regulator/HPt (histidine-containing phosphotransfer) domain-containing protein